MHAFAKINLFLEILGRRSDGYHEIETIFQEISLADSIELFRYKKRKDITITSNGGSIPEDSTNLACRAADFFLKKNGIETGLRIHINKKIPVGAGLGGGSSDAACTLKQLAGMFGKNQFNPDIALGREHKGEKARGQFCPRRRRAYLTKQYGLGVLDKNVPRFFADCHDPNAISGFTAKELAKLGADVPFFLEGGTCAGYGIGERIKPLTGVRNFWLVLVYPGLKILTRDVYRLADHVTTLTARRRINKMKLLLERGAPPEIWAPHLYNRLEEVVLPRFPAVSEAKGDLLKAGCYGAIMSGSGSSVFGIVNSFGQGQRVMRSLSGRPWRKWLVRTIG